MNNVSRLLYAVAITAIGALHFIFGHTLEGLLPFKENAFRTYLDGSILALCGLGLLFRVRPLLVSTVLAAWCIVLYLLIFLRGEIVTPRDPAVWTGAAEILALAGGAFIWGGRRRPGEWLLCVCLVIVGIQHFLYAPFIAGLIPTWIPFGLFWAYFVGAAFLGATASILFHIRTRLVCSLLGLMFFLWVIVLHIPRVVAAVHTETEWTSLFVALGMSGIAWMLALDRKA